MCWCCCSPALAVAGVELAEGVDGFDFRNHQHRADGDPPGRHAQPGAPAAHTIYYEMGAERCKQMGIADSLIRVLYGIEDEIDLLA